MWYLIIRKRKQITNAQGAESVRIMRNVYVVEEVVRGFDTDGTLTERWYKIGTVKTKSDKYLYNRLKELAKNGGEMYVFTNGSNSGYDLYAYCGNLEMWLYGGVE